MIYTLTMNPAIDLVVQLEALKEDVVNRSIEDDIQPNGKGVNVSIILSKLGVQNKALGFQAGFTGRFIEESLHELGIETKFIAIEGKTRINVFLKTNTMDRELRVVNKGPFVEEKKQRALLDFILNELQSGDLLSISGSLPNGVEPSFLTKLVRETRRKGIKVVLDTSYKEVLDCLKEGIFLLKPNEEELSQWFQKELSTEEDYLLYGKKLIEMGAEQVLLSLGKDGAIYFNQKNIYKMNAPTGKVVNTACAGDTLLGTFLGYQEKNKGLEESLIYAIAAGSSTAFRNGLTDFTDTEQLAQQITVIKYK